MDWDDIRMVSIHTRAAAARILELESLLAEAVAQERERLAPMRAALSRIANSVEECGCDHATDDCCSCVDVFCTRCIAAAALAKIREGRP